MTRFSGRPGAFLAAIVLAAGTIATISSPALAAAWPVSRCDGTSGTIIAVNFGHWGGPLLRACSSTPSSGFTLLNQGGWHTTGTEHDGPGFVCRIGYAGYHHGTQYPTPAQQACVLTPPANAYWAFWHAGPRQDTWSYSQEGSVGYHPVPGSIELWSFGGTNIGGTRGSALPGISPDRLRDLHASAAGTLPLVNAPPALQAKSDGPGGSAWPTVVTAAIAAVLAALAVVASRRRAALRR